MTIKTNHNIPVILLLGPTAVGKTSAVLALADLVDVVVYADAWTVYKDLHVGVAKPTLEERSVIPHYMIDMLELDEQLTVADFVKQSNSLIHQLANEGKTALMTGGTLFYLKHFLYGLPKTPPASDATRAYVANLLSELGKEGLYRKLQEVDSVSAQRLAWQDSYRVTRALEVYYDSGKPLSSFLLEKEEFRAGYNFCLIELTRPREQLYNRIDQRVDTMWQLGLIQEVQALKAKGLMKQMPAAKAIGYREFFDDSINSRDIKDIVKKNTRHYAKRQLTFLRSLPVNYRIPADDIASLKEHIRIFLQENRV